MLSTQKAVLWMALKAKKAKTLSKTPVLPHRTDSMMDTVHSITISVIPTVN